MTTHYQQENEKSGREVLPDLVRAFALLGVAIVNVAYFAYPADVTYHAGGLQSAIDNAAYFAVDSLFLFKSYTLFSFMFGVGLAYQMRSAEKWGRNFSSTYFRRMLGLLVLGILHVTLAFLGDILIVYAILGSLLFLFKNASNKTLIRTGVALIIVQVLVALLFSAGLYYAENNTPDQMTAMSAELAQVRLLITDVYSANNFFAIAAQRWTDWTGMVIFALPMQAPGIFGFFLFGLAAVRSGVLTDANAAFWKTSRRILLPIGLVLSIIATVIFQSSGNPASSTALFGYALILLAAPFSSFGYIGLIAKWASTPMSAFKVFVARGGTATLSAYLLQSLVFSLLFCGYGLGLFGKLGAFACVVIAVVVGLSSIVLASLWRAKLRLGPMEMLLRAWTYGRSSS